MYRYFAFQNDKPPQGQFFVSEDMPHLAKFVFDMYGERLQDIQAKRNVSEFSLLSV